MKLIKDLTYKDVIHCETKEQAEAICKLMHEAGLKWRRGGSYLERTLWDDCKEDTCYLPKLGEYDKIDFYEQEVYTIHKAEDFLPWQPKVGEVVRFWDNEDDELKCEGKYLATIDHEYPFIVESIEGTPVGFQNMEPIPSEEDRRLKDLRQKYEELGEEIKKLESGGK